MADAAMIPASLKRGERMAQRVASVSEIADHILEPDKAKGEKSWLRKQPGQMLFATRDYNDTILFPKDHERAGQPRYNWVEQPDGTQHGTLVEGHDAL